MGAVVQSPIIILLKMPSVRLLLAVKTGCLWVVLMAQRPALFSIHLSKQARHTVSNRTNIFVKCYTTYVFVKLTMIIKNCCLRILCSIDGMEFGERLRQIEESFRINKHDLR